MSPTQPGLPRPYYTGHARTDFLVSETQRGVSEVYFSQDPNPRATSIGIRPLPGSELPPVQTFHTGSSQMSPSMIAMAPSSMGMTSSSNGSTPDPSVRGSNRFSTSVLSPASGFVGLPEVSESTIGGGFDFNPMSGNDQAPMHPRSPPPQMINGSVMSLSQSNPFATPVQQPIPLASNDVNEFGGYPATAAAFAPRTSSLRNLGDQQPGSPRGSGRFATFPVKAMGPRAQPGSGSTVPMSPTMDTRAPSLDIEPTEDSFSSSVAQALGTDWIRGGGSNPSTPAAKSKAEEAASSPTGDYTSPPPQYSLTPEPPLSVYGGHAGTRTSTTPTVQEEEEEDGVLAYMTHESEDHTSVSSVEPPNGDSRRVRFESAADVNDSLQQDKTENGADALPQSNAQEASNVPPTQSSGMCDSPEGFAVLTTFS